jgi:hypothetical protein
MKPGEHIGARISAKLFVPLIIMFAFAQAIQHPPGAGAGWIAGLALGLALAVHVLVFGALTARTALPLWTMRIVLGAGLAALAVGLTGAAGPLSPQTVEVGAFALTAGSVQLVIAALAGRAPTLRDEQW